MIATSIADAIAALEAMPSTPRALPCPGCPAGDAIQRLTMHQYVVGRIVADGGGAVRWWSCSSCGMERALDSVAVAMPTGPVASC